MLWLIYRVRQKDIGGTLGSKGRPKATDLLFLSRVTPGCLGGSCCNTPSQWSLSKSSVVRACDQGYLSFEGFLCMVPSRNDKPPNKKFANVVLTVIILASPRSLLIHGKPGQGLGVVYRLLCTISVLGLIAVRCAFLPMGKLQNHEARIIPQSIAATAPAETHPTELHDLASIKHLRSG